MLGDYRQIEVDGPSNAILVLLSDAFPEELSVVQVVEAFADAEEPPSRNVVYALLSKHVARGDAARVAVGRYVALTLVRAV